MKKTIKIMSIVSSILLLNACGYIDPRIVAINLTELPENMKRKAECGPSQSITKPMSEAIVREVTRLYVSKKIIKLDDMENLSYNVDCKKEKLSRKYLKDNTTTAIFNQVCHFYVDEIMYKIIFTYSAHNEDNTTEKFLKEYSTIGLTFVKINIKEPDFTKVVYRIGRPIVREEGWYRKKEWHLYEPMKQYSEKTKGLCRYKRGIRF
jgi:hypothetical protein